MPPSAVPPLETVTPAVVVRARAFGESDKIVTFLTRDRGKVTGIAKGAKRSKRRFVNVLEPFTHVTVRLRERSSSDLAFINACELADAYHGLVGDLAKFAHGSYVLELVDRMIRGQEAGPETYELVRDTLALIDRAGGASSAWPGILRTFELRLLRLTGYEPVLDRCGRCGDALAPEAVGFAHPTRGGVVCGGCRGDGRTYVTSAQTLRRLRELQDAALPEHDAEFFALTPAIAAEARVLVRGFLAGTLTAPLASERLLESL